MTHSLPSHARVVIIGGGIIGTSVAYHLGQLGWAGDVVLLERDQLTSGTTWHAAGLVVTFGSLSETSTELRKTTRDLYARLEAETGHSTGFRPVGFIEAAADRDRLEEYRRVAAFNRYHGVDVAEIGPDDIARLFPLADTRDLLAGFYVAADGRADPVGATVAMAKGARMRGVQIFEGVPVTRVTQNRGRVTGVETPFGNISAEVVVNCAGMWARELGAAVGVNIPNQAAEHYYLITEPFAGVSSSWPILEDPASHGYYREEVGGLLVGLFEPVCAPWKVDGIPKDFSFGEIPPDWDRMTPFLERAMKRVPKTLEVGIKKFFCGPESFTADLRPIVGEAPELRGYFVAAGLNSIGIITGGGMGKVLAHWIATGQPDVDITGMNIDRLHPYQNTPEYRRHRTVESLGLVYACHYPTRAPLTARGAKRSAFHERLAAAGAFFRDVSGWESPDWYSPDEPPDPGPLSFGRMRWFPLWQAEHEAARSAVIAMEMSFMSKFFVEGRDAAAVLDRISTARVAGTVGVITYTQWLNPGGTIEADLTVTRLGEQRFLVIVTDTMHRHAETWLRRAIGEDEHAFVSDATGAYAQLNLQGPRARDLLQTLTDTDLSNEVYPYRTAREISLGYARLFCIRMSYLGELGYELVIPTEQAVHVYDRIIAAGGAFGLRHAGLKALASLRLEKGYRDYGHDIDNCDNLFEAGLSFTLALDHDFVGRDAVLAQKAAGVPHRRLCHVRLDDPEPLLYHAEVVYRDDVAVGTVRAGSYGFSVGGAVGLAMITAGAPADAAWINGGRWSVEIAGTRYPATVSLRPFFDPTNARLKA